MKRKIRLITSKRRGQMFILATMLIAVYVVTMSATILNIGTNQVTPVETSLVEPYSNLKNELQGFLEFELARYTDNSSLFSFAEVEQNLLTFLQTLEAVDSTRSILTRINFIPNSLIINANTTYVENVSDGSTYESIIQARFHLEMSDISSTIQIIEDFNISFEGYAEISGNTVIVRQARNSNLDRVNADSVFVINGSTILSGIPDAFETGIFIFESYPTIDNLGILDVVLPNGVHIYS